jgi:hypothetical protein
MSIAKNFEKIKHFARKDADHPIETEKTGKRIYFPKVRSKMS